MSNQKNKKMVLIEILVLILCLIIVVYLFLEFVLPFFRSDLRIGWIFFNRKSSNDFEKEVSEIKDLRNSSVEKTRSLKRRVIKEKIDAENKVKKASQL